MNPCLKQKLYMNPFMKPKYTNPQSTPSMYVRLPIYTMKTTHACVLIHTTHVCESPIIPEIIETNISFTMEDQKCFKSSLENLCYRI